MIAILVAWFRKTIELQKLTMHQGTWFGIHISDIDDQEWSGATPLPLTSLNRLTRGIDYALEACVLEADHVIGMQIPSFVISREI